MTAKILKFKTKEQLEKDRKRKQAIKNIKEAAKKLNW
jgi:hypothetical protein